MGDPGDIIVSQLPPGAVGGLSDEELTRRLKMICAVERVSEAVLIAHLSEFSDRRLHAPQGHTSLFEFCLTELGFSESAAYKRILVARAARRFPVIIDWLASGRVHLSALAVLAPHFSAENLFELLEAAQGAPKRRLEAMVAALAPRPDRRDVIRRLPAPEPPPPAAPIPPPGLEPDAVAEPPPAPPARQRVEALSAERVHFGFTGSERFRDKLQRVRELMWHSDPAGRLEFVFEKLADFYLDRKDPDRRLARRATPPSSGRRRPAGRR